MRKVYDAVIVGGGIAGLTAAAYVTKYGYKPILLEQQSSLGGMINSFSYKGFVLDGGIRSIESLGVVKPMLKDLDIDLDFRRSHVTLGIKDHMIHLSQLSDTKAYEALLISIFPENETDIRKIFLKIHRILKYMDVLYGIDNPMIVDLKAHKSYVYKTLFPWFFKFVPTLGKIEKLSIPVETYLKKYTDNPSLIDMIAQHFFKETPAFFALGYFTIYFDYHYPQGGTGKLPEAVASYILTHGGKIQTDTQISRVCLDQKEVIDSKGERYAYQHLIWAADLKALYDLVDMDDIKSKRTQQKVISKIEQFEGKIGAESVLTVYALVDLDPDYFKQRSSAHCFYTPKMTGLNHMRLPQTSTMDELIPSLKEYLALNTYEISIPALRDLSLAPQGQTGLIISILFDYDIVHHIEKQGYYDVFKSYIEHEMIEVLSQSIYPDLSAHVLETFCSTPLTFKKRTGSTDGAIIGWSYTNKPIPVAHKMSKITQAIRTDLPFVLQAGQWSFSPAGVPISIITGKLAADKTKKSLKKLNIKDTIE